MADPDGYRVTVYEKDQPLFCPRRRDLAAAVLPGEARNDDRCHDAGQQQCHRREVLDEMKAHPSTLGRPTDCR